jgi:hypothetical protein
MDFILSLIQLVKLNMQDFHRFQCCQSSQIHCHIIYAFLKMLKLLNGSKRTDNLPSNANRSILLWPYGECEKFLVGVQSFVRLLGLTGSRPLS